MPAAAPAVAAAPALGMTSFGSALASAAPVLGSVLPGIFGASKKRKAEEQARKIQEASEQEQRSLVEGQTQSQLEAQQEARKAFQRRIENARMAKRAQLERENRAQSPSGASDLEQFDIGSMQSADRLSSELAGEREQLARQKAMALAGLSSQRGAREASSALRRGESASALGSGLSQFFAGEAVKDRPFGGLRDIFGGGPTPPIAPTARGSKGVFSAFKKAGRGYGR